MRNRLTKLTALSLIATSVIYAGGYKIPEVSTNGVALSAATVAHSTSADAAYYNPANMIFMEDKHHLEMDLLIVGLDATTFKGSGVDAGIDIKAEDEVFFIPNTHYVSPKLGDARIGVSIAVPGGLTKRWNDTPAVDVAQEFTLSVVEVNPTVAIPINDQLAVAFGFRIVHSEGIVRSTSRASRDMIGDSIDFGYNLALAYKPTNALEFGMTYRSKVSLTEEGNAKLTLGTMPVYDGGASVNVPLPALFNLAAAYTFDSETTVEFVYERNFWDAYSTLDFNYTSRIPNILVPSMDNPIAKDWKNTNTFRLGITQELDDITLMAGVVIDQTPVPDSKVSYELPDSDSLSVSFGGRYQWNESWNFGFSTLYSMRDDRVVDNSHMTGTFSTSNVLIVSTGIGYTF